jgi:hypothetical protein
MNGTMTLTNMNLVVTWIILKPVSLCAYAQRDDTYMQRTLGNTLTYV